MIPSELFFDLVDAGIRFRVTRQSLNEPGAVFEVGRAADQQITLKHDGDEISASAGGILAVLNQRLLTEEYHEPVPLAEKEEGFYDPGSVTNILVETATAPKASTGLSRRYEIEVVTVHCDLPTQGQSIVAEVTVNGRSSLRRLESGEGFLLEHGRIAKSAVHRPLHARMAGSGSDWNGTPSLADSFVAAYGQEALNEAKREWESARGRWDGLMRKAAKMTEQDGAGPRF